LTKRRIDLLILDSNETITATGSDSEDIGIIDDGGVAVHNGEIVEAASSQLLDRKYSASRRISANGQIVLPGFIDPHTHLVFQGSREEEFQLRQQGASYVEIMKRGGGIMETVNKTRMASQNEILSASKKRLDIALESGTTTLEIKSGYGLQTREEVRILKIIQQLRKTGPCRIAATFLGAHAIPPYMSQEEYSKIVIEEMLPAVVQQGLADFCDVFCEDGAFDTDSSKAILIAGARKGLRPKIHADQFTDSGGAKLANDVKAVSADHLTRSNKQELQRMGKTSVVPVLLPGSSHSLLNNDFAPARDMLTLGLPVALGTDHSPSNWILGLLTVAAIAARGLRMRSSELIRGITINASKALGLDHFVGSLSPGKSADIVVLKAPTYKWVGYTYGEGLVDKVLIRGKEVVSQGKRVR
jgi:imidazolonepropionase